jgi:hypothetical protein
MCNLTHPPMNRFPNPPHFLCSLWHTLDWYQSFSN